MTIGILKETLPETRVSLLPEHLATLQKWGVEVLVESGAGTNAFASDEAYRQAGATIANRETLLQTADIWLSIQHPSPNDFTVAKKSATLLGIFQPLYHPELMQQWATQGHTVLSIDMIPRTTRAQSMDVLSSQANIAGYKAVVLAASIYPVISRCS